MKKVRSNIFLDSGAFSAFGYKVKLSIKEYIDFVLTWGPYVDAYSVLDTIGNAKETYKNQLRMEAAGLTPIPCFHYGDEIKYLKSYLDKYDYISLGGMVPINSTVIRIWLDELFTKYICKANGMPRVKIHGFGVSSFTMARRYPWYSIDSTNANNRARFGSIVVPSLNKDGSYNYMKSPFKPVVSSLYSILSVIPINYLYGNYFSATARAVVEQYVKDHGFVMGKSEFKQVESTYELKDNERWMQRVKRGKAMVEILLERGVSNDSWMREELVMFYTKEFEQSIPKWPWSFKAKQKSLMSLL